MGREVSRKLKQSFFFFSVCKKKEIQGDGDQFIGSSEFSVLILLFTFFFGCAGSLAGSRFSLVA